MELNFGNESIAYKIFISVGESSGDIIGAKLMKAFKTLHKDVSFYGIGGELMEKEGLNSLFDIRELMIMGFSEVIPAIPRILRRLNQTVAFILNKPPDCIITIDSPGFNWRLVKKIRKHLRKKIKIINYVAPSVWAYKENRVYSVAKLFDHQLLIFPFEKPYFDKIAFPSTYVGHPVVEDTPHIIEPLEIRSKYLLSNDARLVALLPGSRRGELKYNLPIFKKVVRALSKNINNLQFWIPTLPDLLNEMQAQWKEFDNVKIITDKLIKQDLLLISEVALVKSGTVTAEMMQYGVPMVVTYNISKINQIILSMIIKNRVFSICNLVLGENIVPEVMPPKLSAERVYNEIFNLLTKPELQRMQRDKFKEALAKLKPNNDKAPSIFAAETILGLLKH